MQPVKAPPYNTTSAPQADGLDLLYDPASGQLVVIMQVEGEPKLGVRLSKESAKDFAHHLLHYAGADA